MPRGSIHWRRALISDSTSWTSDSCTEGMKKVERGCGNYGRGPCALDTRMSEYI